MPLIFMPILMLDYERRNIPAMDSDGCNASLLNPLNKTDGILELKPQRTIKLV